MKRFIITAILFLAASAMATEAPDGLRSTALVLLDTLQATDSAAIYPEEYKSFTTTVEAAEELNTRGEDPAAARLFSLAALKGEILLKRSSEILPVAATLEDLPSEPVFTPFSSEKTVQPEDAATDSETSPATADDIPDIDRKLSARIIGGKGVYTVQRKESLRIIASRLGVRLKDLAKMNLLKTDATLYPGDRLKYNNRRIVPKSIRNGIVVNIPDRSLYLLRNGRVSASYPVALGIAKKKESKIWRTPVGRFQIIDKQENPSWRIPLSIQKEMEENGEEVVEVVPPGPKNPLGKYAMRTTLAGILIHSTSRPASINSYSSHGCIRVMPEHMERLFKAVSVPMQGEIVYQPVKMEVTGDGRVFLEVNRDSYGKLEDISAEVRRVINNHRAVGKVSWQSVNRMITEKSGIAEEVTLAAMPD